MSFIFYSIWDLEEYVQSLAIFNLMRKRFEDEIPRVSALSRHDRARFVITKYENLLYGLYSRPRGWELTVCEADGIRVDEFKTFCDALTIGWKLWPDCWAGLTMMLDWIAENMSNDDISRLDTPTLNIIKEIALCKEWPNNPLCGPGMVAGQAKCILIRFTRQCSFSDATWIGRIETLVGLTSNAVGFYNMCSVVKNSKNVCEGIDCFQIESDSIKFKVCSKCKKATYCSKKCQVKSWKALHKTTCRL